MRGVRSENLRKEIPWTSSNLVEKSDKKLNRSGCLEEARGKNGNEREREIMPRDNLSQAGGGLWAWGPFLGEGKLGQNPIAQWTFSKYTWVHPCSGLT